MENGEGRRPQGTALDEALARIRIRLGDPADLRVWRPARAGPPRTAVVYLEGLVNEDRLHAWLDTWYGDGAAQDGRATGLVPGGDPETAWRELARGYATVLREGQDGVVTLWHLAAPGWELRPIAEPMSEQMIRGPREGFTETISVNTAMIRRWITDPGLRVDELHVGARTGTAVRLLYLTGVASPALVQEVKGRIARIDIDGVIESGYLEQLITDRRLTLFPLIQSTERSDKVVAALLEGRVAVLVDKSPFALIVPTTINELYQSPEDYYFGFYLGSFLRFFRLLGSNLAVMFSGLYVALSSINPELLPTNFAFAISESRRGIPYPIFLEVLFLEVMVEVFREAGLRLPRNVNQTLGVVTGVALALAAVQSHLVSGASLVVVSIGAIASFSAPSFAVSIPWRILKFAAIAGAALLGIVGLTLTGLLVLAHAATLKSFGTSYLAPWAPLRPYELRDAVTRVPLWLRFQRPLSYRPVERQRMGNTRDEDVDHEKRRDRT